MWKAQWQHNTTAVTQCVCCFVTAVKGTAADRIYRGGERENVWDLFGIVWKGALWDSYYYYWINIKNVIVPLQTWGGPEVSRMLMFPEFMTSTQDSGNFVSVTHRPHFIPGKFLELISCLRISQPHGHSTVGRTSCQLKLSKTQARIKPRTFRFVAQHFNHCATAIRHWNNIICWKTHVIWRWVCVHSVHHSFHITLIL